MLKRVIFNRKGGVGKSTITCNLACIAANKGKKVLVIDLDPQANSTSYLGHDGKDDVVGIAEYLESTITRNYRKLNADDFIRKTDYDNLFLISASGSLTDIESKLEAKHKIYKLRSFLESFNDRFDEVYIDTPPALNFYTLSALIAADRCLIPFDCSAFARDAMFDLVYELEEIIEDHNPELYIEGVVVNQFVTRANLPKQAVAELQEAGFNVLEPYLSSSIKVKESHALNRPMIYLEPRHKVSEQFIELYKKLNRKKKSSAKK